MNIPLPTPLPLPDRALLRFAAVIVPVGERGEWLRCWEAEMWHRRHPRPGRSDSAADLYPGVLRDAAWLRTHGWRRAASGTAALCLSQLAAALFLSVLPLWAAAGDAEGVWAFASAATVRFGCEASLVALVSFATSSRSVAYGEEGGRNPRWRARVFQALKMLLVLLTAFLLSEDLTRPLEMAHRFTAEVMQPQIFVLMALIAMRWSFEDQENRCKQCLRSLAAPARVGRPSWNFLDSNGTEMLCRDGHGLLSIPEIETSWRRSSYWIAS